MIAPASTGSERRRRIAVTKIAQTKSGSLWRVIPGLRILSTVVIKFIAPSIEEIPDRCRLKIARSTEPPEWLCREERGGYQ